MPDEIETKELPPCVHSMDQHRSRYHFAIEHVHVVCQVEGGGAKMKDGGLRPGEKPENVFDFRSGVRLVISRDRYEGHPTITHDLLHASGSLLVDSNLWRDRRRLGMEMLIQTFETTLKEVSGRTDWEFSGFSPGKMIPHWHVKIKVLLG